MQRGVLTRDDVDTTVSEHMAWLNAKLKEIDTFVPKVINQSYPSQVSLWNHFNTFIFIAAQLLPKAVVFHRAGWGCNHILGHWS